MLIIQGPFPANTDGVVLPSPQETNTESLKATVQSQRTMSGRLYTYVKPRNGYKKFRWEFLIGFKKARELESFVDDNSGEKCLVSWGGNTYVGYLTLNPLDFRGEIGEFYRATLEFEEKP